MKFKDKEGRVFDDIDEIRSLYCIGRGCQTDSCNLAIHRYACGTWTKRNPYEAARLMGYEVVEDEPTTNADRIRAMSDEELKVYLCYISDCSVCLWQSSNGCKLEDWLKQPYKP